MNLVKFLIVFVVFIDFLKGVELTKTEQEFVKNHTIVGITTTSWEPFNFIKEGKLQGISIDYWNFVKNRLNLKTGCKIANSWSDVLENIKNKKADITFATSETKERKRYAVFSKPYASFPIVIATRNDVGFIPNMDFLRDKKIAVGKNYSAGKLLKKRYPYLKIIEVKDIDIALKMLDKKRVYAVIDILPVLVYKISQNNYFNVKISGKTDLDFKVRFMVRDDYKTLIPMINRVIDSMTIEQKNRIYKKWISVSYQKRLSIKYIEIVVLATFIIIVFFLIWIFLMKQEIKKREKLEKKLKKIAMFDRLTDVYNRYKLDMVLEKQIKISDRYQRDLSIIFLDIDKFKTINDTYGHEMGDLVLKKLSELILKNLRSSDIFGRWGGEEFLIVCPETDLQKAVKVAEKLRKEIENFNFHNNLHQVTSSFGVVEHIPNETMKTLLHRVDKLLYKAKENGRNRVETE